MFLEIFKWINTTNMDLINNINGINIISDSQNCIKLIQQSIYPKDEKLIKLHKKICKELESTKINNLPNGFIKINWVQSHANGKYNNEVDTYAKIAALLVLYIADNDRDENYLMNPNNYIAYNTIKKEIKYKIKNIEKNKWNNYKYQRKNDENWSNHNYKWNIPYTMKYAKELIYLTKNQNNIRIMIYTNHLPLNYFNYKFLKKKINNHIVQTLHVNKIIK